MTLSVHTLTSHTETPAAPAEATKKIWTISTTDFDEDDDAFGNRGEGLLDATDLAVKTTAPSIGRCNDDKL